MNNIRMQEAKFRGEDVYIFSIPEFAERRIAAALVRDPNNVLPFAGNAVGGIVPDGNGGFNVELFGDVVGKLSDIHVGGAALDVPSLERLLKEKLLGPEDYARAVALAGEQLPRPAQSLEGTTMLPVRLDRPGQEPLELYAGTEGRGVLTGLAWLSANPDFEPEDVRSLEDADRLIWGIVQVVEGEEGGVSAEIHRLHELQGTLDDLTFFDRGEWIAGVNTPDGITAFYRAAFEASLPRRETDA